MANKLKSLAEHNKKKSSEFFERFKIKTKPNGFACPHCGKELEDVDGTTDTSMETIFPPQIKIKCLSCFYTGARYL